jgi:hypothetical protein
MIKKTTIEQLKLKETVIEKDLDYYQNTIVKELEDKLINAKDIYEKKKEKMNSKLESKLAIIEDKYLQTLKQEKNYKENLDLFEYSTTQLQDRLTQSLQKDQEILREIG